MPQYRQYKPHATATYTNNTPTCDVAKHQVMMVEKHKISKPPAQAPIVMMMPPQFGNGCMPMMMQPQFGGGGMHPMMQQPFGGGGIGGMMASMMMQHPFGGGAHVMPP